LGEWEPILDAFEGRASLTGQHFCGVFAHKVRLSPEGSTSTDAEATALFRTMPAPFGGVLEAVDTDDGAMFNMTITVAVVPTRVGMHMQRLHRATANDMRGTAYDEAGVEGTTGTYIRRSLLGSSPLAGAWELVSSTWDGIMLTTDSEYLYIVTRKDRPEITGRVRDISDADAAELYRAFDAQAGSYELSGSTLTRQPTIARDPRERQQPIVLDQRLADSVLTTRLADADSSGASWSDPRFIAHLTTAGDAPCLSKPATNSSASPTRFEQPTTTRSPPSKPRRASRTRWTPRAAWTPFAPTSAPAGSGRASRKNSANSPADPAIRPSPHHPSTRYP
jgi:hypothetical protein